MVGSLLGLPNQEIWLEYMYHDCDSIRASECTVQNLYLLSTIIIQNLADVVACNRDPNTDMVRAFDTWNVASYNNEVDDVQDVILLSSDYSGGRITCR